MQKRSNGKAKAEETVKSSFKKFISIIQCYSPWKSLAPVRWVLVELPIHGITMKNITIDAELSEVDLFLASQNEESDISDFELINITANGKKITDLSQTAF